MPLQKMIADPETGEPVLVDLDADDLKDLANRRAFAKSLEDAELAIASKEEAKTIAVNALPDRETIAKKMAVDELQSLVLKLYDVVQHLIDKG